jgi:hypothetical protein
MLDFVGEVLNQEVENKPCTLEVRRMAQAVSGYLSAPGCENQCDPCTRKCAVLKIHLRWWQSEEARLMREFSLGGVPAEWLADLQEAQVLQQRLQLDIELAAPAHVQAYLEVPRRSLAAAH